MNQQIQHLSLPVTGMTCAGCASRVTRDIGQQAGVTHIDVNLALEMAEIDIDPATTDAAQIADAIGRIGFGVREQQSDFRVTGMTCASCAARLEKALQGQDGVIAASVNLATETASIRHVTDQSSPHALVRHIEQAGFGAAFVDDGIAPEDTTAQKAKRDLAELVIAALLSLPLLAQMAGMVMEGGRHLPPAAEFALATPVLFYMGRRFFTGAWMALKNRSANMDVLVSMGAGTAWAWSSWLWLTEGHLVAGQLYFEAAAVIVTLVLLGKYLETRARNSASEALRDLMALRPVNATVWRGGKEEVVAVEQVSLGDIVIVKPGERLPVDGMITRGDSDIDESLVTGESLPVARKKGDTVVAGSVNGNGLLKIRTTRIGKDTSLARIAAMVASAQTGKAPIQRLVDRISAIFVPVIIAIALLAFTGWWLIGGDPAQGLAAAISVLVIACPCALGLATPTALVAGTGVAARHGILIRDIESLERASSIDQVVFDKTGTLTKGHPVLAGRFGDNDALRLAAAAQQGSEHPLAKAFLDAARDLDLPAPDSFKAITGEGIEAQIAGDLIRLGRHDFVTTGDTDPALQETARQNPQAIQIWLSVNGNVTALFLLEDQLRGSAGAAVKALHQQDISTALLTGDRWQVADALAARIGIDDVTAETRPEDKKALIETRQQQGRHVAMTGDGINDAPALAAADLGIAMGSGTDIAMKTAGITLMRSDPALVPAALDIARATRRKIRQNLFWAFIYNVIGVPIAAAGLLNPAVAGAAMALSSVSVVSNSLRLKSWKMEQSS